MKKKDLLKLIEDNSINQDIAKSINELRVYSGFLNPEQSAALKKELDFFDKKAN